MRRGPIALTGRTLVPAAVLAAAICLPAVDLGAAESSLPSWSQALPCQQRFVVLRDLQDAAVLDKETGLVWERAPRSTQNWNVAHADCYARSTGGKLGWRLPGIEELMSLFGPPGLTLPEGHPFDLPSSVSSFWSSTTRVDATGDAYSVVPPAGVMSSTPKGNYAGVWCVRGGGGGR